MLSRVQEKKTLIRKKNETEDKRRMNIPAKMRRNEKKSNNTEADMVIIPTKNSMNIY